MSEANLPVPAQLEAQLAKCKTVRGATEYYKSREKSSAVSLIIFCASKRCVRTTNIDFQLRLLGNGSLQIETTAATCCIEMITILFLFNF